MGWSRGQPYSQDLRDRVLGAEAASSAVVAERFGVSRSYVVKARQRRERTGELSAGPQRSHTPAKLAGHDTALRDQVASVPDATLAELCEWARMQLGVSVSTSTMWTRLRRLGLTLKKRRWSLPSSCAPILPRRASVGTA